MKTAFLLSAAAAVLSGARAQEEEIDLTSAGMACAGAGICGPNGCLAKAASLVLSETAYCRLVFDPVLIGAEIGPSASDGHSFGALALLLDAELDNDKDALICGKVNNSTFFNACVAPVPLRAMVETMWGERNGVCEDFNTVILGMVNAPSENAAAPHVPVDAPSVDQKLTMEATTPGVVEQFTGNAASMSQAMGDLGLEWSAFVAPALGFNYTVDVEGILTGKQNSCVVDFATSNGVELNSTTFLTMGAIMAGNYTDEEQTAMVTAAVTADAGAAATVQWLVAAAASGNYTVEMIGLITSVVTGALNETELEGAVMDVVVNEALSSNSNSSGKIGAFYLYSIGADVDMDNETEVGQAVGVLCQSNLTCSGLLGQDIAEVGTSILATSVLLNVTFAMAPLEIGAIVLTSGYSIFAGGLSAYMETCVAGPYATIMPFVEMFAAAAAGSATEEQMQFITMITLANGCALKMSGVEAGANPRYAAMSSCYLPTLLAAEPEIVGAIISSPMQISEKTLIDMQHSANNLQTRCDAASVPLTNPFPEYVVTPTGAPTLPAPTGSPTPPTISPTGAPTTVALNGGAAYGASILVTIALATLALF
jgi:hypothetical protein